MKSKFQHDQKTTVTCSDNGKGNLADVISFIPEQRLIVSLNKSIRMEMTYNPRNKLYVAHQTGLEFVSSGPGIIETKQFKRR
jgi:hypothetical protein